MIAVDYPFLELFWTILWFFLWFAWIMLLFRTIGDIFRSADLSGWGKTLWLIFVVVLPFLGVFVYIIARGGEMTARDYEAARSQERAFRDYVQEAAAPTSNADELTKLADLKERGVLSAAEFEQQKAKLLT